MTYDTCMDREFDFGRTESTVVPHGIPVSTVSLTTHVLLGSADRLAGTLTGGSNLSLRSRGRGDHCEHSFIVRAEVLAGSRQRITNLVSRNSSITSDVSFEVAGN